MPVPYLSIVYSKKLMMLLSTILLLINVFPVEADDTTILHVGGSGLGNYTGIQDAIDDARDGSTIYVYRGTYYENIRLYKPIKLIGEDKRSTVIDGRGIDDTVFITGDDCTLENFTVKNCSKDSFSNIMIQSNGAKILNNVIVGGSGWGLYLYHASNVVIVNNTFIDTGINIIGGLTSWNTHTIKNNTVNGKKLCYYSNVANKTFSENVGQLILANCTNFVVQNVNISKVDQGITLGFSSNNSIINSSIHNTTFGIKLHFSFNNNIQDNKITGNKYGIYLTHSSCNNIFRNTIKTNTLFGCWLCCGSTNNTVYLNKFISNNQSAYDAISNHWHKNNRGNYWSDYKGEDADGDGVGDIPYYIPPDGKNQDKYPLVFFEEEETEETKEDKEVNGFEVAITVSALIIVFLSRKKEYRFSK